VRTVENEAQSLNSDYVVVLLMKMMLAFLKYKLD